MLNLKRGANDRFAKVASSALRTLVGKDKHNFSGTEDDSLKQAGKAHPGQLTFGTDRQGLREGLGGAQQGSRANNGVDQFGTGVAIGSGVAAITGGFAPTAVAAPLAAEYEGSAVETFGKAHALAPAQA